MRILVTSLMLILILLCVIPWHFRLPANDGAAYPPGEYVTFSVDMSDTTWSPCTSADSIVMVRYFDDRYWERRVMQKLTVKGIPDSFQAVWWDSCRVDSVRQDGTPVLGDYKVHYFAFNACGKGYLGSQGYRVTYSAESSGPVRVRVKAFTGYEGAGTMIPGVHVSVFDWNEAVEMWEGETLPGDSSFTFYTWANSGSLKVRLWKEGYSYQPETLVVAAVNVDSIFWGDAFDPGDPGNVLYCRVWGYTQNVGRLIGGIKIRARLRDVENVFAPGTRSRIVLHNVITTVSSSHPDSLGYWYLDLIRQKYLNPQAYAEVKIYGTPPEVKYIAVPDSTTAGYGWLPDLYE